MRIDTGFVLTVRFFNTHKHIHIYIHSVVDTQRERVWEVNELYATQRKYHPYTHTLGQACEANDSGEAWILIYAMYIYTSISILIGANICFDILYSIGTYGMRLRYDVKRPLVRQWSMSQKHSEIALLLLSYREEKPQTCGLIVMFIS